MPLFTYPHYLRYVNELNGIEPSTSSYGDISVMDFDQEFSILPSKDYELVMMMVPSHCMYALHPNPAVLHDAREMSSLVICLVSSLTKSLG